MYLSVYFILEKMWAKSLELASKLYLACFPNTNLRQKIDFQPEILFHVDNFH